MVGTVLGVKLSFAGNTGHVKLGGEVGHVVELAHHLLHELGGRQRVVQGEMLVHRNTVVNGPLYFFSGVPDKGTF